MEHDEYTSTADELAQHMRDLGRLMDDPFRNAVQIEQRRQLAAECIEALSAYVHMSVNFQGL